MENQDKIGFWRFVAFFALMWGVGFTCMAAIFFVFRRMADEPGDPMTAREAILPSATILLLSVPGYALLVVACRNLRKLNSPR